MKKIKLHPVERAFNAIKAICIWTLFIGLMPATSQNSSYRGDADNITGTDCSAYGYHGLWNNASGGIANIGIGKEDLYNNSGGDQNIAVGYQALYLNTAGNYN